MESIAIDLLWKSVANDYKGRNNAEPPDWWLELANCDSAQRFKAVLNRSESSHYESADELKQVLTEAIYDAISGKSQKDNAAPY